MVMYPRCTSCIIQLLTPFCSDAADEVGITRRYVGIYYIDSDSKARIVRHPAAQQAWKKSLQLFMDHNELNEKKWLYFNMK